MPRLSVWNSYRGNPYLQTRKALVRGAFQKMDEETSAYAIRGL